MSEGPRLTAVGDGAVLAEFGEADLLAANRRVRALYRSLRSHEASWLLDLIPAYRTLLVQFDPLQQRLDAVLERIEALLQRVDDQPDESGQVVVVPVRYGGAEGPDLADVAQHTGLSQAEVIARHTATEVLVMFIGFSPGFPYLWGMDPTLTTPRLATPRRRVPAGSVGIGGDQTGIYPSATPGGWRIIGRTDVVLYDPRRDPPTLLRAGDRVRFEAR